jgi:hypothetical protein
VWDPMLLEFELGQEAVLPCLSGRSGWDPMDVELLAHSMTSIAETGALLVIEEVVILSFVDTTQSAQVGLAGSTDVGHSTAACEIVMGSPSATTPTLETVMFLTVERMWASVLVDVVATEPGLDVPSVDRFVTTMCDTTPVDMQDDHIPTSLKVFA